MGPSGSMRRLRQAAAGPARARATVPRWRGERGVAVAGPAERAAAAAVAGAAAAPCRTCSRRLPGHCGGLPAGVAARDMPATAGTRGNAGGAGPQRSPGSGRHDAGLVQGRRPLAVPRRRHVADRGWRGDGRRRGLIPGPVARADRRLRGAVTGGACGVRRPGRRRSATTGTGVDTGGRGHGAACPTAPAGPPRRRRPGGSVGSLPHARRPSRGGSRRAGKQPAWCAAPGARAARAGALLHARGGPGSHALLQLGGALRGAARPLAQALELARLREDEQREDRDPGQRRERRDRTDLGKRVRKRER